MQFTQINTKSRLHNTLRNTLAIFKQRNDSDLQHSLRRISIF